MTESNNGSGVTRYAGTDRRRRGSGEESDSSPSAVEARTQILDQLNNLTTKIVRIETKVDENTCAISSLAPVIASLEKKRELSRALKVIRDRLAPIKYHLTVVGTALVTAFSVEWEKMVALLHKYFN